MKKKKSRDVNTVKYLQAKGVKAFLSPLILLLRNPNLNLRGYRIILVRVKAENVGLLPSKIQAAATMHVLSKGAYQLLQDIMSAKLVITENLQYALACVALETPVIYINDRDVAASTILGSLVHMVDMQTLTPDQARSWFQNFTWDNIPPNPNPAAFMRLRATSWNVIRRNQNLYDAARKFGVVPMTPPLSLQTQSRLIFHLIFSTSEQNSIKMFFSLKKVSGKFNWRHWRSIESIFHHHPEAEVRVHSNTLPKNTFDVLTEAGYSIAVHRYKFEDMLKGTQAKGFIKKLRKARMSPFWYSHQTDLLRLFFLYKYGGVYMDTDIILVRPVDKLKMNTVGWENSRHTLLNGAFAKFEKGNLFLRACLKDFVRNYRGDLWAHNCPALLTRVYKAYNWDSDILNVVDHKLFYMIEGSRMNKECFTNTEGEVFDSHIRTLEKEAFVVHTNSKISGTEGMEGGEGLKSGTICKHLLNSYCVLCDQTH